MTEELASPTADIRIILAEGNADFREELRRILAGIREAVICGEAPTGQKAVALAVELRPDVAVVDLALPGMNGLDVTRQIKSVLPSTEILVFTTHDDDNLMRDVLGAGARGYLLKSEAAEHMIPAIEALAHHWPYLTTNAKQMVLEGYLASNKYKKRGATRSSE